MDGLGSWSAIIRQLVNSREGQVALAQETSPHRGDRYAATGAQGTSGMVKRARQAPDRRGGTLWRPLARLRLRPGFFQDALEHVKSLTPLGHGRMGVGEGVGLGITSSPVPMV